jgi:hypothetical protein
MRYVLTCQDNLSKYLIAIPLKNQTAESVTEAFVKNIILIYGIPNEIVTDQGTNFMGDVFKRICKLFKIEKISTTAYHPESNGPWNGLTRLSLAICDASAIKKRTIGMNICHLRALHIILPLIR